MHNLEDQLKNLNRSPASEPDPRWTASLRSKLAWMMERGEAPEQKPMREMKRGSWFHRRFAIAAASLALLLLIGGGVTYAAQGVLPGSPLYPVKLASEEMRLKLAANETARTKVELERASRRVDEFRVLSSQQKVTPEIAAELSARYESHVSAALQALPTLPEDIVQNVSLSVADAMDAHVEITASFGQEDEELEEEQVKEEQQAKNEALKETREQLKRRKEEIRKQLERMRAFSRESRDAANLLKETSREQDIKVEVKIETDEEDRAHVKINAERKKNGKEEKKEREYFAPTTTIDLDVFDDEEDTASSSPAATSTGAINRAPTLPSLPSFPTTTSRILKPGTRFEFRTETSGSGSINQELKTEIKSESKIEIKSSSSSDDEGEDD